MAESTKIKSAKTKVRDLRSKIEYMVDYIFNMERSKSDEGYVIALMQKFHEIISSIDKMYAEKQKIKEARACIETDIIPYFETRDPEQMPQYKPRKVYSESVSKRLSFAKKEERSSYNNLASQYNILESIYDTKKKLEAALVLRGKIEDWLLIRRTVLKLRE